MSSRFLNFHSELGQSHSLTGKNSSGDYFVGFGISFCRQWGKMTFSPYSHSCCGYPRATGLQFLQLQAPVYKNCIFFLWFLCIICKLTTGKEMIPWPRVCASAVPHWDDFIRTILCHWGSAGASPSPLQISNALKPLREVLKPKSVIKLNFILILVQLCQKFPLDWDTFNCPLVFFLNPKDSWHEPCADGNNTNLIFPTTCTFPKCQI